MQDTGRQNQTPTAKRLFPGPAYVSAFVLSVAAILLVALFYYQNYARNFRAELESKLSAIAELKAEELFNWRKERLCDAEVLSQNPLFCGTVKKFLEAPETSGTKDIINKVLTSYKAGFGYERLILFDSSGTERISFPAAGHSVDATLASTATEATRKGKAIFLDLHPVDGGKRISLAVIAPFGDETGANFCAVAFIIDPITYLFPFIRKWPSASRSAETLLVRRDSDEVTFLNDLRFRENTALNLKLPLSSKGLPAAMAARGETGIVEGIDYRNEPVIADIRPVKNSPWFIVSKMDISEVYGPLRERLYITAGFSLLLAATALAGILTAWRRREYEHQLDNLRAEKEKAGLWEVIEKSLNEVYVFDSVTLRFVFVNSGALRNLGFTMEEMSAMTPVDIKPLYSPVSFANAIAPLLSEAREVLRFETVHRRKNGSDYDVEVHLQLIVLADKKVFLAVINDITERKKAEAAILETSKKYGLLFQNLSSGFALHEIILDSRGIPCDYRFLEMNPAFEKLTGARAVDLVGKTVREVMPGTEPYWIETYGSVAITGIPIIYENYSSVIGKHFEIRAYSPEPGKFATVFNDITGRKESERLLNELNATLERRVAERTAQLEASNRELEAFAYSVSHDLRVPLRAIDGFSGFLLEDYSSRLDDEGRRILGVIRSSSHKMDQLISDLLSLSRISRSEMKYSKIDMKKLADVVYYEGTPPDAREKFDFSSTGLDPAEGDENLIRQVWVNLISNAVKYSMRSAVKKIVIGCYSEPGSTVYFIRDNGAGFDQQYAGKLFGAFQRLHKTDEFEGTGIGLAIVQRIIHRHGGRVWAEGKEGLGATFYFTLPSGRELHEQ